MVFEDKKIKVLHISQSVGGVETYLKDVFSNIDRNKIDLALVFPVNTESMTNFCIDNNIRLYKLKIVRGFGFTDLKNIFQFYRIIKKEQPDIVHLHSSKAGFLGRIVCKIASAKSIFTPHGLSYLSFKGFNRLFFFYMELFVKPFTDNIVTCSYSEANRVLFEIGISQDKVTALLNSIPIKDDLAPVNYIKKDKDIHIGTIARLTYQKNPLLFVEIAKLVCNKYPNVHFSILGAGLDDHLKSEVVEKINEYQLAERISIYNWGSKDGSANYLRGLDIFMLTSVFEGLPLSLLEAMAAGVPCIVSKSDGCNDVINNNVNGFSCMTKEEFSQVISKLIEDDKLISDIGAAGRKYVATNHDIKKYVLELESYYQNLHK